MQLLKFVLVITLIAAAGAAFAQDASPAATEEAMMLPVADSYDIVLPEGTLPEGIEYDSTAGRFLLGSLTYGTITAFDPVSGALSEFIVDEELASTVGIHIDVNNNRLLVTNSAAEVFFNPASDGMAQLAAYDLETGERIFLVDLGALYPEGRHFANDVTVDADGNAYVTDSFSPVIYRVDLDGNAEVFVENEAFTGQFIGLNGIDVHPDDYVLACVGGRIYRIDLSADTPEVVEVALEESLQIDGLAVDADGVGYAVVSGNPQRIVRLVSEDGWASATVDASVDTTNAATTLALAGDEVYYINAYLGDNSRTEYEIVRAAFETE